MNKTTLTSLISALSCSSLIYAGGMGGEFSNAGFISLEGGYVVNSIPNYSITFIGTGETFSSTKSRQTYAGRLAGGLIIMMDDQFGVTSELGWGYYGRTTLTLDRTSLDSLTIKYTLTGFDALIGIAYIQPNFTFSLKGGALIQNLQNQTDGFLTDPLIFPTTLSFNAKSSQAAALPEIKIGASYNFDTNWSLTAAYVYALGSSPRISGTFDVTSFNASLLSNTQNPTLNMFLLGVQFTC